MSAGVIGGATSGMEDLNVSSGCKDEEGVEVTWGGGIGLRGGGVWAAVAAAAAVVVGADPGAAGIKEIRIILMLFSVKAVKAK